MSSKKLPVVFSGLTPFMGNKILDRSFMSKYPGGAAFTTLAEVLISRGYEFMTADQFFINQISGPAFLISDMAIGYYKHPELIPAICYSLESPVIAYGYYHYLQNKTKDFHYIFDWSGAGSRVRDSKNRFLPIYWPTTNEWVEQSVPWSKRRFVTMCNSNKRAFQWRQSPSILLEPYKWARGLAANLRTSYIRATDSWMKNELYLERMKAIRYFSRYTDFDLYGSNWDDLSSPQEHELAPYIKKVWRGFLPYTDKLGLMSDYKFCLCYENAIFPGYLTEKLFDCFFAGVIPVYLGDPEVTFKIPRETYIDLRDFSSFSDLDSFMHSITPSKAQDYLDAARLFVNSDNFEPFTAGNMAENFLNALKQLNTVYK